MKKTCIFMGTFLLTLILVCQPVTASCTWAKNVVVESYCTNSWEALGYTDGDHATLGVNADPPRIPDDRIGTFILDFDHEIPGDSDIWIYCSSYLQEDYGWRLLSDEGTESSWTWGCDDTTTTRFTTPEEPPGEVWIAIEIATEDTTLDDPVPLDPIYGSEIDAVKFFPT